jgi:FkbM family methyltransferase
MTDIYSVDNYHNNKPFLFKVYDNCEISNKIKCGIIWEKHMHDIFEQYITENSIVLEAGCHIGTHTLKLASLCKHLHAFEPLPSSHELLEFNINKNNITNVTLYKDGLANIPGTTSFAWISPGNPGASGLANNPMGIPPHIPILHDNIHVNLVAIDGLNLDKLDFIKLDTEGYEELVIYGGINTIIRCKPVITLECWSSHTGTVDYEFTKKTFKILLDIGYELKHINGPDFLFIPVDHIQTK